MESYYTILGVNKDTSDEEIRRAYRKLAMQWHPDKWTKTPSMMSEANRKFQRIQEAYAVLSDQGKRLMYDVGLYDPQEEEDEGFGDFLQEMTSLMADVRKEDKNYSMEDIQGMFWEMAQSFEFPQWSESPQHQPNQWFCGKFTHDDLRSSSHIYESSQLFCGQFTFDGYKG